MARPKMTITAVGDFLPQRRLPETYDGFEEVRDFICRGDARFYNLETTFPDHNCYGHQFYGGTYLRAGKEVLKDAGRFGLNMLSFANNHTLDYSYQGLIRTLDIINEAGIPNAGVGRNLDEAAAPAYLDTPKGSVALIGVVSTMMNVSAIAGRQSRRILGRPGVNGLRVDDKIVVTDEQFKVIKEIADLSNVNAQKNISIAEGFTPPFADGILPIQTVCFERGEETRYETHPNKVDMDRVLKAIYEARGMSDYVVVSMHSHEVGGNSKENPGDFYVEFAHKCIDAGATAVLGHGPHIIRPMEIYKGKPIFYCMGNFVFQEELTEFVAEDMYEKYHMTSDETMRDVYIKRTKDHTCGLLCDRRVLEAIIPYIEVENDVVTKVELMPISMGAELEYWQMGLPRPGYGRGILERLAAMSEKYGTKINIREDGNGEVVL